VGASAKASVKNGGKEFSDAVKDALMLCFVLRIRGRRSGLNYRIQVNLPLRRWVD
jgi:hypothetical protein